MLPRRPVLLGGVLPPVFWTGILHSFMGFINPALDARISWAWYAFRRWLTASPPASWSRAERILTSQSMPFVARLGVEDTRSDGFETRRWSA